MLAHIAEETTRLSHGFLGALFSVIIALSSSREQAWYIALLCVLLYVVFLSATGILYSFAKIFDPMANDDRRSILKINYLTIIPSLAFFFIGLCCVYFGFIHDKYRIFRFDDKVIMQVEIGCSVFALFMSFLIITHMGVIFARPQARARM
jgi:uncharacterized membrane protein